MEMNDYLYELIKFRIAYILGEMSFYQKKLARENCLEGESRKAAQARVDEWGYEANRLEWLLHCVDEGGADLSYEIKIRPQWKWALKGLFKFAKRCKSDDNMPKSELCYVILGCWAAEELLGVAHY